MNTGGGAGPPRDDGGIDGLSTALERLASWLRRITPRGEYDLVAMSTLDALAAEGPQRISDLAARERISQPGMTGVVTRLAEAGFVERRPDPTDGRAALVTVTDTGRTHLAARHAARAAVLAEQIGRIPEDHRRALLAATGALTELTASAPHDTDDHKDATA
ncbi:MarR family winged helix-turn-helix transcriptional regulator [Streptomyces meridianus]|uniref:MarR family transcriptional regulator n=1 Tax=Streptomyces meridianus TaxID=2938945 RepID=A0ABT0XC10_9ACTN|nr:MarR family transcriptional regulator [Streptomyces meridianus]MCM2580057.1 MarR family transcriptional regulator [Streptomyces meridianus]